MLRKEFLLKLIFRKLFGLVTKQLEVLGIVPQIRGDPRIRTQAACREGLRCDLGIVLQTAWLRNRLPTNRLAFQSRRAIRSLRKPDF